jgi:3D-(3,5/4)-trihydroxycyclohexane-1,2-dione acylhydrolase (decyclizing)
VPGGVLYSEAEAALARFAERHRIPVAVTQAGKGALVDDHPFAVGAVGVTGTGAANALAETADVILAIGTRLQDFTTGSRTLFKNPARRIVGLNVQPFDAGKHWAVPLVADADVGLTVLSQVLGDWQAPARWVTVAEKGKRAWTNAVAQHTAPTNTPLPSDAQVIGAVQRGAGEHHVLVAAAGGLPGELHKLWQADGPGSYHLEYGYSCMGYEIAGGLGVKIAAPDRTVIVMVGDGSYLMMNSEIATSVMLGLPLVIVVPDNRGFGCINRLQQACGGAPFNNLFKSTRHSALPAIDFAAHARSLGADARKVASLADLESAVAAARGAERTTVLVIETDPAISTGIGGHWWDVAVPEVSPRDSVEEARRTYEAARARQRLAE